jgi:hypothetical protein
MHIELLIGLVGIAMVVVGFSGRGVRFWNVKMPPIQGKFSRIVLVVFGIALAVWGIAKHH